MKLHIQSQPSNKILWPELYFAAEANKESFQDVQVITTHNHEYVKIHNCEIRVGVKSSITDDIMWKALDMVADALDKLEGRNGVVYFGSDIQLPTLSTTSEYLH